MQNIHTKILPKLHPNLLHVFSKAVEGFRVPSLNYDPLLAQVAKVSLSTSIFCITTAHTGTNKLFGHQWHINVKKISSCNEYDAAN